MSSLDLTDALSGKLPADPGADAASGVRRGVPRVVLPLSAFLAILVLWEALSRSGVFNALVLPPPTAVGESLVDLAGEKFFWEAVRVTLWEAFAGFWIGAPVGFLVGTLIGLSDFARRAIYPLAVALQSTPQVAIAPLFLVWFGFGLAPRIAFAATLCVFPVLVAVVVGLSSTDSDARTLLRSLGATRWQVYRKLQLPASMPILFAGIRTVVPLALVGAIIGEFVGGNEGLGVLITTFNSQLRIDSSFAVIAVLAACGIAAFQAVEIIDRRLVFWNRHDES